MIAIATVVTAVSAGCAGCTDADCSEGVTVHAPDVRTRLGRLVQIRVCVEGRCTDDRTDSVRGIQVEVPVPDADEVDISVTIRRLDGRVLADGRGSGRVEIVHPNGERCDPHCREVTVRLRDGRVG